MHSSHTSSTTTAPFSLSLSPLSLSRLSLPSLLTLSLSILLSPRSLSSLIARITRLLPLIRSPYLKKTNGTGTMTTSNSPSNVPAHRGVSAVYSAGPARGSVAPKSERMTVAPARADAA